MSHGTLSPYTRQLHRWLFGGSRSLTEDLHIRELTGPALEQAKAKPGNQSVRRIGHEKVYTRNGRVALGGGRAIGLTNETPAFILLRDLVDVSTRIRGSKERWKTPSLLFRRPAN